jgi:hypothetical protein
MYGRKYWGALRATFVIGPDGVIAHVIPESRRERTTTRPWWFWSSRRRRSTSLPDALAELGESCRCG